MKNQSVPYSLRQILIYFLKLGTTGFGGPVALVGYMHKDLVEDRKWISAEEYKQGLALAQLAPGPLAAQLGIYLGFVHYRILGATLAGIAFVLPSFIMVVLLGMAYRLYGGLSWMQSIFYGVGSSVIGIILLSVYKLTLKSIGALDVSSLKKNWLLWVFFGMALIITTVTKQEHVLLFVISGVLYMLVQAPPSFKQHAAWILLILSHAGFWDYETSKLEKIALFFLKAGTFVFGSGLAIIPFLHSGVVNENHWLNEQQFLDSVAVAMITPGPVVITVGFIGYLISGFFGAVVAALATFLPCYLFTVLPAPYFNKIAKNESIKAFVNGITASVIGALAGAVLVIATQNIVDIQTAAIAVLRIYMLIYFKMFKEPYLILISGLIRLIIKGL